MLTPRFFELLDSIAQRGEYESVGIVQNNALQLTKTEFHLLLARAIRHPEILKEKLRAALEEHEKTLSPTSPPSLRNQIGADLKAREKVLKEKSGAEKESVEKLTAKVKDAAHALAEHLRVLVGYDVRLKPDSASARLQLDVSGECVSWPDGEPCVTIRVSLEAHDGDYASVVQQFEVWAKDKEGPHVQAGDWGAYLTPDGALQLAYDAVKDKLVVD